MLFYALRAPGGNVPGGRVGWTDVSAGQVGGLPGSFFAQQHPYNVEKYPSAASSMRAME